MKHETTFGVVIVGDEILSGKRQDKHLPFIIDLLHEYGYEPQWVYIVGDQEKNLTDCLRASMQNEHIVFCLGGIGATPDDITRQCAAAAANLPLTQHPEATALLQEVFKEEINPQRLLMAKLPQGVELIPNPVNKIAGFSINNHHFVPGFPKMAHPMLRWVMEEKYSHVKRAAEIEYIVVVKDTPESEMIPMMKVILENHPDIRLSSLPSTTKSRITELAVKGECNKADSAYEALCHALDLAKLDWQPK